MKNSIRLKDIIFIYYLHLKSNGDLLQDAILANYAHYFVNANRVRDDIHTTGGEHINRTRVVVVASFNHPKVLCCSTALTELSGHDPASLLAYLNGYACSSVRIPKLSVLFFDLSVISK